MQACFEGGGLRIALAVDSFIYFANIRPNYKVCGGNFFFTVHVLYVVSTLGIWSCTVYMYFHDLLVPLCEQ